MMTIQHGPKIMLNYTELSKLKTFDERFRYLKLNGAVGQDTFGFDRYLNQVFYSSQQWKSVRDYVIRRDEGCDLGIPGHEIYSTIYIHHMNPITPEQLLDRDRIVLDPEFLISVSFKTHNAIHYGDESILQPIYVERLPNDMAPWKNSK